MRSARTGDFGVRVSGRAPLLLFRPTLDQPCSELATELFDTFHPRVERHRKATTASRVAADRRFRSLMSCVTPWSRKPKRETTISTHPFPVSGLVRERHSKRCSRRRVETRVGALDLQSRTSDQIDRCLKSICARARRGTSPRRRSGWRNRSRAPRRNATPRCRRSFRCRPRRPGRRFRPG